MVKTCAFCEKTDGMYYISNPPKRKCTITGKFHEYDHICDVPITNADRIRAMSDEEIAQWLCLNYSCTKCLGKELCTISDGKANGLLKWLKQPVE